MTAGGALAVTGAVLGYLAAFLAVFASFTANLTTARRAAMVAFSALGVAVVCFIAAAWWTALT